MKKICVVIGSRANYASVKSAMSAIAAHSQLELQLVVCASALLDRYGNASNLIREDGFRADATLHMLIEGETPETMAKSTGLGLIELPTILSRLGPDVVLTVGDRFETMATTLAAAYMNIPLAHTMGGEVSGSIDESVRHAVTKFSHIHFPATMAAKKRIESLGEDPDHIFCVGCPRIDIARQVQDDFQPSARSLRDGTGGTVDLQSPFLLVAQHPVTSEFTDAERQINETLEAVASVGLPAIALWPNADAGSAAVAQGIRQWRETGKASSMHFYKNLPAADYLYLLKQTACLVGNSSSGIREAAFFGTPVVNIGSRQARRERAENVVDAPHDRLAIRQAIDHQLKHGSYDGSFLYGDGTAGVKIAETLATIGPIATQKSITY